MSSQERDTMAPVVSFVGKSGTGKTTLLEKLIEELTARGYRVGVIKHTVHHAEFDGKGKDTLRHRQAGASPVAIDSPGLLAVFQPLDEALSLEQIADQYFTTADIIITEGFKREKEPQFVVLGDSAENMPDPRPANMIGVVCDAPVDVDVPVFSRADVAPIADMIQETFLKKVSRSEVRLWVDGKFVPLKPFVKAFVGQTVKGMLNALKGVKAPEKIHIKIGR